MALRALESNIKQLLYFEVKALENRFVNLLQEDGRQESVIQQLSDEVNEVDILKLENAKQKDEKQQLTSGLIDTFELLLLMSEFVQHYHNEKAEAETMKQENSELNNQIKQLRIKANEVETMKQENSELNNEIQQLVIKANEARSSKKLKQRNSKLNNKIKQLAIKANETDTLKRRNSELNNQIKQLKIKASEAETMKQENNDLNNQIKQLKIKANEAETMKQENSELNNQTKQLKIKTNEAQNKILTKIEDIEKQKNKVTNNLRETVTKLRNMIAESDRKENYNIFKKVRAKYYTLNDSCTELNDEIDDYDNKYQTNKKLFAGMVKKRKSAIDKVNTFDPGFQIDKLQDSIDKFREEDDLTIIDEPLIRQSKNEEEELHQRILNKIESNSDLHPLRDILAAHERTAKKRVHEETDENSSDSEGETSPKKKK